MIDNLLYAAFQHRARGDFYQVNESIIRQWSNFHSKTKNCGKHHFKNENIELKFLSHISIRQYSHSHINTQSNPQAILYLSKLFLALIKRSLIKFRVISPKDRRPDLSRTSMDTRNSQKTSIYTVNSKPACLKRQSINTLQWLYQICSPKTSKRLSTSLKTKPLSRPSARCQNSEEILFHFFISLHVARSRSFLIAREHVQQVTINLFLLLLEFSISCLVTA